MKRPKEGPNPFRRSKGQGSGLEIDTAKSKGQGSGLEIDTAKESGNIE